MSKEVTTRFLRPGHRCSHPAKVRTRAATPHLPSPFPRALPARLPLRPVPRPLRPRACLYCLTSNLFHHDISSTPWLIRHHIHDSAEVIAHDLISRVQVPSSRSSRPRSPRFESLNTPAAQTKKACTFPPPLHHRILSNHTASYSPFKLTYLCHPWAPK